MSQYKGYSKHVNCASNRKMSHELELIANSGCDIQIRHPWRELLYLMFSGWKYINRYIFIRTDGKELLYCEEKL